MKIVKAKKSPLFNVDEEVQKASLLISCETEDVMQLFITALKEVG